MKGRVFKSTGSWYTVQDEATGHFYQARLRGKFKLEGKKVTNPIAVGDLVELDPENEASAIITDILPRENYLIRKSTRKTAHHHILAANIDQAVVMITLHFPRTSLGFIDRFLVTCESYRIPALFIFNKKDLLEAEEKEKVAELQSLYESLGYETLLLSATDKADIPEVQKKLKGKTSLLAGHSGVGKSTLLNALAPHIEQKTDEVSTFANKGKHTTTFAEMFALDQDTFIIDTPGIKELGLSEVEQEELSHYFPEMREYLNECKFHNCRHVNEPGCVVRKAVEEGEIAESRYKNYLSMLEEEDTYR